MALIRILLTAILAIGYMGVQAAVQPDKITATPADFMIRWPADQAFNPDQEDLIKVWKTGGKGKAGKDSVTSVAFSPDDRTVFVASQSGVIRVWRQVPAKFLSSKFQLSKQVLNALAVSPDGQYIATGGGSQPGIDIDIGIIQLWRWDGAQAQLLDTLKQEGEVTALKFSSDGRYLLGSSRSGVGRIWERESLRQVHVISGHADIINDISFSVDDEYVVTGGSYGAIGILELWQWLGRKKIVALGALKHTNAVNSVSLSAEAKYILAGGSSTANGRNIALWKRFDGSLLHTFPQHKGWVRPVMFSADSEHVLSGGPDGSIKVWHRPRGNLLRTTVADGETISAMAISHNGRYLLSGSDKGTVHLRQAVFFNHDRLAKHVYKQAVRYFEQFQRDMGIIALVAEPKLPKPVVIEPFSAESERYFQVRVRQANKKHAKRVAAIKEHYITQLKHRNTQVNAFNTDAKTYWSRALAHSFADFCGQPRLAPGAGVTQEGSQYVVPVQLTCTGIVPALLRQSFVAASERQETVAALHIALMKKDTVAISTEWSVQERLLVLKQATLVSNRSLVLNNSPEASQFQLRLPAGQPTSARHQKSVLAELPPLQQGAL